MSRHEGVSCDSCNKNNFRGKRFKCLVCYDYDLCAQCHDSGAVTTRHLKDHPMQCILTRTDFELYYGGEALTVEQPQSFCCPFCGKLGLTDSGLQEHVSCEHPETMTEVVCPVCAALPRGDPNHVTDDFIAHLNLEHRAPSMRDFDEPTISRGRRILHGGRSLGQVRARRTTNQNFASSSSTSSSTTAPLLNHGSSSSGVRDTIDPIAKLLSQLSGVRRSAQQSQQSVQSQLQLLQQQLQFEREQVQQTRERLERLPRRPLNSCSAGAAATTNTTQATTRQETTSSSINSGFLLSRCTDTELSESEQVELEVKRAKRSLFVQDLLVSTLGELSLDSDGTESYDDLESEENCSAEIVLDPSQGETSATEATSASKQPLSEDMELINLEDDKDL